MIPSSNTLVVSDEVVPEVTESVAITLQSIQPFDKNDTYVSVDNRYELVEWRYLPSDAKHRFYEETVFRHQPAAQYNSITRTRKHGVDETNHESRYSSNHLSGFFAPSNLERLKGKEIEHVHQK